MDTARSADRAAGRPDVIAFYARFAVVLGPLLEQEFRRAMAISGGGPSVFLSRRLTEAILLLVLVALTAPVLAGSIANRRRS